MEKEVIWDKKNHERGYLQTKTSKSLVYKPRTAIKECLASFCGTLVRHNIEEWRNHDTKPILTIGRAASSDLMRAYPALQSHQRDRVIDMIKEKMPSLLDKAIKSTELDNDFVFLAKLGRKRDWRSGCAICLTEEMMGTTCSCGHTEIAIFRPCGHSICKNPCFIDFIKEKGIIIKPKTILVNDQSFVMPTNGDINIDTEFECPLCRTVVNSVFQAEETSMNKFYYELLTDDIVQQFYDSMFA
jgi:hypothetical protein